MAPNARKGRGKRKGGVNSFTDSPLRESYDLVSTAASASTKANVKLARRVLKEYCAVKRAPDPKSVTPESSKLILNLLADYCKFGTADALKNDSMGALAQGLRHVYCEEGHTKTFQYDGSACKASGNPLIGNPDLQALRKAHRVHLAHLGFVTLRSRPITAANICDLAEKFWYGRGKVTAAPDVLLHAILVVGLNLGLRYDEIKKLKVQNVSVGSGGCTLTLLESIKNSTVHRTYQLRDWFGNSALRFSYFMDPFLALYSWLTLRGSSPGPLFCDVNKTRNGWVIDTKAPWSSKKFTEFFRGQLSSIGVGSGDLALYSGHSIKRGSVQLYRSLGLRDEAIMEIIQMSGYQAYSNYCAAYNDCAPPELPRFNSVKEYVRHAETICEESEQIYGKDDFAKFLEHVHTGLVSNDVDSDSI